MLPAPCMDRAMACYHSSSQGAPTNLLREQRGSFSPHPVSRCPVGHRLRLSAPHGPLAKISGRRNVSLLPASANAATALSPSTRHAHRCHVAEPPGLPGFPTFPFNKSLVLLSNSNPSYSAQMGYTFFMPTAVGIALPPASRPPTAHLRPQHRAQRQAFSTARPPSTMAARSESWTMMATVALGGAGVALFLGARLRRKKHDGAWNGPQSKW